MKQGITVQERLKDLMTERHLKLEELAAATKISKSALGSYENDELKEISHKNLVELAKFYGVSTDYLLCLTENRNHPDTGLTELHLSDDMVELLKSGRINNRLLCEIATHGDFVTLMTDTEIYVDGVATSHFQNFNSLLEVLRGASPFPIPAGRGRYCFKGVGSHADTGRRLFLSGYTPDLGRYPPCHKGSAQGRYGQCAGRLQCHETDQRRKEGTGCAGFLSGCVHRPYVYATANPV